VTADEVDDRDPEGWLETVTLAGSDEPVRVRLEERQGNRVLLRQVDPGEPLPPRVPLYSGDEIVVMQAISHMSVNSNDVVGDVTGLLFSLRTVPVRYEPGVAIARTLRRGEVDTGARVHVRPGDQVRFEEGGIVAELDHLDDIEPASASGYVPLTPVLATWFAVGHENSDAIRVRYLLAAARRLDTANLLLMTVETRRAELNSDGLSGPIMRRAMFELIGAVEVAVVALGRTVDMVVQAKKLIDCPVEIPGPVRTSLVAITEIRNAYEHIEDRALGQVRQKEHPDALTIFDQASLITDDKIVYGRHQLDLADEVPKLLASARGFFKAAAADG
jgi:hypothetical protein